MTDLLDPATAPEATDPPPATPPASTKRRPGPLRGDVWLTLHTIEAALLLLGRQATDDAGQIPSINSFGHHVHQIMTAASNGDIYARQALVTIDGQLDAAERQLRYELGKLRESLCENSRFSVVAGVSTDPSIYSIRLASPYAHWAARLIGLFDEVIAAALTARHIGLLTYDEFSKVRDFSMKAVRRTFHWASRFRVSGVTLDDVLQGNARATDAEALHGAIRPDIKEGKTRPAYLH